MSNKSLFIVGAGGLGREVAYVACLMDLWENIYFVDDILTGKKINNISVIGGLIYLLEKDEISDVFIAISNVEIRRKIYRQLRKNNLLNYPNIFHPKIKYSPLNYFQYGIGNYIAEGLLFTVNINLGNFNIINCGVALSHDTSISDFCTLMHGVKITGGARLESDIFLNAGVVISNPLVVPKGTIVFPNQVYNPLLN